MKIRTESNVEESFRGRRREMKIWVEEKVAKRERCIGGTDVRDEKRLGVGEFVVREKRTNDGEKGKRRIR